MLQALTLLDSRLGLLMHFGSLPCGLRPFYTGNLLPVVLLLSKDTHIGLQAQPELTVSSLYSADGLFSFISGDLARIKTEMSIPFLGT